MSYVSTDVGLPPDLLARARTRVAGLATVLGALSLIALLLNATVFRGQVATVTQVQHLLGVVLALIVVGATRYQRVSDLTALSFGLAYEVFLCWIVAFAAQHSSIEQVGSPPEITWNSMIIVLYPMVIPLPPRRLLVASVLAAISSPVSLLVLDRMGEYPVPPGEFIGVSIGPAFAVILAYFGARMIYAIGLDVSQARLMGAYRLESKLGDGGMGEVWRASHRMLARPAAVKLIAPNRLGGDGHAVLARFEREAQATALLRSPHTVEVYDFGLSSDGSFYYVMELLDGMDLQKLVEVHGPVPASRAAHILAQACHSLSEAHAASMVHRDIKPANIFVCHYGSDFDFVKVLDFGLVKQQKPAENPTLTQEGQFVGTPAFMAPEMALDSAVDGRADLYSLGCVAYWLLTGSLVFEAKTPVALVAKHLNEEPIPPSERTELSIPADIERVVMACLCKNPADRPPSAAKLADMLGACAVDPWSGDESKRWWERRYPEGTTTLQH